MRRFRPDPRAPRSPSASPPNLGGRAASSRRAGAVRCPEGPEPSRLAGAQARRYREHDGTVLRFFSRPLAEADAVESTSGEVNVQAVSVRPVQSKSAFFSMCLPVHHLPTCTLKDSLLIVGPRPSNKTRQKRVATSSPPRARASLCKPPLQAWWAPPPPSLCSSAAPPQARPSTPILPSPPWLPGGRRIGPALPPPIRPLSARVLVKGDAQEVPAPGPTHPPSDAHFSPLAWPGWLEVPSRA
ncbi:hypothetical protein ACCO45_001034 [Purpureocillium lilacinum]|uniref:Uncharacterized protein n=1 Tax=Purpureocillium lilacinum TaxID=33203 RepID=A0ACC4E5V9_PURLI